MEYKELTGQIIGAAIEVHRRLGPGYLESAYEEALCIELEHRHIGYERQKQLSVYYRGQLICEHRLDLVVERLIIVELKAISAIENIHFAVLRSYLKAAELEHGLLLNFASVSLTVKRVGREQSARITPDLHV
ncbi:MAG: GxxExxY protein [Verrucomicrobiota bacterium]